MAPSLRLTRRLTLAVLLSTLLAPPTAAQEREMHPAGHAAPGAVERSLPRPQDARRAVALPEMAREKVLSEMRQMLEALHGVLRAAVAMDRRAMEEAALSGGTRIAVDADPAVAEGLPAEFIRLGEATHLAFDGLASVIAEGAGRDTILARLGRLTANCVSCHASYRVVTSEGGI